jgi:hypothetical protein
LLARLPNQLGARGIAVRIIERLAAIGELQQQPATI